MLEFDYSIDYKNTLFEENDKRYRIGRGDHEDMPIIKMVRSMMKMVI